MSETIIKYAFFLLVFMLLSRFFHSLDQLYCHGVNTYLPGWVYDTNDWTSWSSVLDGFHVMKDVSYEMMLLAGVFIGLLWRRVRWWSLLIYTLLWIGSWQVFNALYEYLWRA